MPRISFYLLPLLFAFTGVFAQRSVTGKVLDDQGKPLLRANVMAIPNSKTAQIKFAPTTAEGTYKIILDNSLSYELSVSYLGYFEQKKQITTGEENQTISFDLKQKELIIDTIEIKYEYKPIEIKKDTVTFNVKSIANGNERKLKEVLEKTPGVEVEKNGNVTFQGKPVTTTMVENRPFFGGGSKLAVENIPADALDKIEFIDHFNNSGVLKKVTDSDRLAMNIKLKKDKMKFVFGDVEASAEVANDNDFYKAHAGLFYYSPKLNLNYIGDVNTIGKSVLGYQDVMRIVGMNTFLSDRKPLTDLFNYTTDNTDVLRNKGIFNALNADFVRKKWSFNAFGIVTKSITESLNETNNQYFQNTSFSNEQRTNAGNSTRDLALANIKIDYKPTKKKELFYNGQFIYTKSNDQNLLNIQSQALNTVFDNGSQVESFTFEQLAEWNQDVSKKHTYSIQAHQVADKTTPNRTWQTNQPFLTGLIPILPDTWYQIMQTKNIQNHTIDFVYKHFYQPNFKNQLSFFAGLKANKTDLVTSESQLLTSGAVNGFENAGFGNQMVFNLNDYYLATEYKRSSGKWKNTATLYWHNYFLSTKQNTTTQVKNTFLQPQWQTEYSFNETERLTFNYKLNNNFADAQNYAENFVLQSYNSVFRGNAVLQNERLHTASLFYNNFSFYKKYNWFASINYTRKTNALRNDLVIDGINQFSTPIITDNPESNANATFTISRRFSFFKLSLDNRVSYFNYKQNLNEVLSENTRVNQNYKAKITTTKKNWPILNVSYAKNFGNLYADIKSSNTTDTFQSSIEIEFLKHFNFEMEYENFFTQNDQNSSTQFEIADARLQYKKNNSPLFFELSVVNLFDARFRNSFRISDYLVSENKVFILPRMVMFTMSYKL
jgi:hypothetical protein